MTTEVLAKANQLQQQIASAQLLKANHLIKVKSALTELPAAHLTTIVDTLSSIHDSIILPLQTQFAALDGRG